MLTGDIDYLAAHLPSHAKQTQSSPQALNPDLAHLVRSWIVDEVDDVVQVGRQRVGCNDRRSGLVRAPYPIGPAIDFCRSEASGRHLADRALAAPPQTPAH